MNQSIVETGAALRSEIDVLSHPSTGSRRQKNEISPRIATITGSKSTTTAILLGILKYHILILVASMYIYLLNQCTELSLPHLSQIYFCHVQDVLVQILKGQNITNKQEIIAISIPLYHLTTLYFASIYNEEKFIFSKFLFLFVLWGVMILIFNIVFKQALLLMTVFIFNFFNLLPIEQIEAQELTVNIFYISFSFYLFKLLVNKISCPLK
jgi:hypothetical protein